MEKKYLEQTKMLNYDAESIQTLIDRHKWLELDEYHKIGAVYDFVRNDILFGYNRSDLLTATEVLKDGYGQCNTKATLLMALLRGVGIPCRLHGSEVSKHFQRGAASWLISVLAPERIVHTWVEVLYKGNWIALEGVITDECYVRAVKDKYKNVRGHFARYAVAVPDLESLNLNWCGNDTYVQNDAVVMDYGVYDNPDTFFEEHHQTWSRLKNLAYMHYGRKVMTGNVAKMRNRKVDKQN
ncbi:MAG: transglutaminase domain-containing protein [Lachnospiraceae bacterium]|nr:transglutaminase domain-containing protein [Lachnospiraceae bacterium]